MMGKALFSLINALPADQEQPPKNPEERR